jgi:hypothetical protein
LKDFHRALVPMLDPLEYSPTLIVDRTRTQARDRDHFASQIRQTESSQLYRQPEKARSELRTRPLVLIGTSAIVIAVGLFGGVSELL